LTENSKTTYFKTLVTLL